jgi:hypothetical protein
VDGASGRRRHHDDLVSNLQRRQARLRKLRTDVQHDVHELAAHHLDQRPHVLSGHQLALLGPQRPGHHPQRRSLVFDEVVRQVVSVERPNRGGGEGRQRRDRHQIQQQGDVAEQQRQVQDRHAVGRQLGQRHAQIGRKHRLASTATG